MGSFGNTSNPDFCALASELDRLGVPKSHYSVGREKDERTCILNEDEWWLVYFFERGNRGGLRKFKHFEDAKQHFIAVLVE